jgi:hypothetical protein
MADRHDDVDDWLSRHIEPLPPPPGTFDLIKRRARRRRYRRLAITASSAAVLVAAAVTVPQVVNLHVQSPNPTTGVAAGHSSSATPTGGGSARSSAATQPRTPTSAGSVPPPVPPNFRPTSVTFVGTGTGWVIGQAGTPGHCATQYCTSIARTDNAGRTWSGVPAPLTGPPDGATGVSQIRFLNLDDGWAYGPQLFATHSGGKVWTPVDTHGLRVTDLEAVGSRVFAVFASCTGSGQAFAAQCTSFTLYSAPAAGGDFTPVGAATTGLTDGSASQAVSLVLTGSLGYLLAPGGALYAGPVDGSAAWQRVSSLVSSCAVGPPQPDGQPSQALLGAVKARELLLACTSAPASAGGSGSQQKRVLSSPNGGLSWLEMSTAPAAGIATSLAASPSESVILGTDQGIDVLPAGGIAWQPATLRGGGPAGGFGYVGMTTSLQGIALPADPSSGTIWFTFDGGRTWQASRINGS